MHLFKHMLPCKMLAWPMKTTGIQCLTYKDISTCGQEELRIKPPTLEIRRPALPSEPSCSRVFKSVTIYIFFCFVNSTLYIFYYSMSFKFITIYEINPNMCCVFLRDWETIVCQKETIFLQGSLALAARVFESAGLYPSQTAFTDSWDSIRVTACSIRIQMYIKISQYLCTTCN